MSYLFSVSWGAVSGWWTIACVFMGLLYAFVLYRQPAIAVIKWRFVLFIFRAVTVFIVSFLLLAPLIKSVSRHLQKPLVLVLQDNSSSIKLFPARGFNPNTFIADLASLKKNLGADYDVREFNFDKNITNGLSPKFNGRQTDISAAFDALDDQFSNQNIGAVILASDGLYNLGSSPINQLSALKTSIYTIALGDTTQKRDAFIDHIDYNKTAFLGNDFIADVFLGAHQFKTSALQLSVLDDGKLLHTQQIKVDQNNFSKEIPLKINASKKGLHKYQISIKPLPREVSTANNQFDFYVDVLDNRKKALILYGSPHPDVAALRQSLATNPAVEVKAISATDVEKIKLNDFNLLILEQLPDNQQNINKIVGQAKIIKLPVWFLAGAQSNLSQLNLLQNIIQFSANSNTLQEAFAAPDASFTAFILLDSTKNKLAALPPLLVPFGNYSAGTGASVLLKQKIGSLITSYPLLALGEDDGRRVAVLAGEGLWKWQLNEYQQFGNHHALDELVNQTVQYLTIKNNQKRFNVTAAKPVFDQDENVLLTAELYNPAYQLVNQPDVSITLKNKNGKTYSYQFSRKEQSYLLNAAILPAGDYTFEAKTALGKESFTAGGVFTVKQILAEAQQSTADHQLLYNLARQTGGIMVYPNQIATLANAIRKNDNIKTVAYQDSNYRELIDEKAVFFMIVILLSAEWFFRKRNGEI